jgi:hypothetical protein
LPGSAAAWVTNFSPTECFTVVATLALTEFVRPMRFALADALDLGACSE